MEHHTSKFTQGLNMPVLSVIAIVGVLVVWVSVVGVQGYYETGARLQEQQKVIAPDFLAANKQAEEARRQQLANLRNIEQAKQAVIAQYGGKDAAAPKTDTEEPHH